MSRSSRRPKLREHGLRLGAPLLFLVFLLGLWELAAAQGWVDEILLPPPREIAEAFVDLLGTDDLRQHLSVTLYETVAGFLLGASIGIALAIAASVSTVMRYMIYPYAIALQVTPRIAFAPILIAWLGFGSAPKIVLAATLTFFPVFINALTGMVATDRDAAEMFRSIGASRLQTFIHLRLPSAMPVTFAGLKTGMTLALIGAIVGEFISADEGLGLLIQQYSFQVNMASAIAVILVLTLMGFVLYGLMEYMDRLFVFWLHDSRMNTRSRRRAARAAKRPHTQRQHDTTSEDAPSAALPS
jgi:NitT/TauT family transport system permease protein